MKKTCRKAKSAMKLHYDYNRVTHLYQHDKYLDTIPQLSDCQHLSVMYLHNNEIHTIENLGPAHNLTSLYLQHNRISKIEGLNHLKRLKKLYLGNNNISVVERLENLDSLEELHVEKQYLVEGSSLCFDPRSIAKISSTLQVLDISHNKVESIACLAPLKFLITVNASHNELEDLQEICNVIRGWCYLREASFAGNPAAKSRLYKEHVIANASCLEVLDKRTISEHTRILFKNLYKERTEHGLRKIENMADEYEDLRQYPTSIQKAVSVSMLKNGGDFVTNEAAIFDERNAVYIPWKTLPKPQPNSKVLQYGKHHKKLRDKRAAHNLNRQSQLEI